MTDKNMTIKEVKKDLGITDREIAGAFGYSTPVSYRNSTAKKRIEAGIVEIYRLTLKKTT